jgi:hypothetical protein
MGFGRRRRAGGVRRVVGYLLGHVLRCGRAGQRAQGLFRLEQRRLRLDQFGAGGMHFTLRQIGVDAR